MQASEAKRKFWEDHVEQWQNSGSSVAAYCREHDLKWFQLHYWKKKFANIETAETSHPKLRLVPIGLGGSNRTYDSKVQRKGNSGLRLTIDGIVVDLDDDFDRGTLKDVVRIIRG